MPIWPIGRKQTRKVYLALAAATAAAGAFPTPSRADNGLSQLISTFPTLDFTGAGINVAQVEADLGGTPNKFEVNPAAVNQPASLFSYIDDNGNISSTFTPADDSGHADTVGNNYFGGLGSGMAPGVAHVDNYSANSFYGGLVATGTNAQQPTLHNDTVISQSYAFLYGGAGALSTQQALDFQFDSYVISFPSTILVSAAGASTPSAPGTAYNSITVNCDGTGGNQVTGPTLDGRDKPDIEAFPTIGGEDTSYATPMVSGAATLMVQAGARGDGGGVSTESAAVDPRVVKALLMNGAVKAANWSTGVTSTNPLNNTAGAGDLNIFNSYLNLRAGEHNFGYTDTQAALLTNPSTTVPGGQPTVTPIGWNFTTATTSTLNSDLQHYLFNPIGTGTTTFTATLNWWRNTAVTNSASNPINNLFLYLYDQTSATFLNTSVSTINNVQEIYATGVNAADQLDLIMMKKGGLVTSQGVVSNLDTYALAWNEAPITGQWTNPIGGSWLNSSNWANNTMPNGPGGKANLMFALTSPQTVTLDGPVTVGDLFFNNVNFYTVAPGNGGTLTLDDSGVTPWVSCNNGNQTISAPVILTSYGVQMSPAGGTSITFAGPVSGPGEIMSGNLGTTQLAGSNSYTGGTLNTSGTTLIASGVGSLPTGGAVINGGTFIVNATSTTGVISGGGSLTINPGATIKLALGSGTSTQSSLALNGTGSLDITDNTFVLNYGTNNPSPVSAIGASIASGYSGATYTGPGIVSSKVASVNAAHTSSHFFAIGYADASDPAVAADHFTPGTVVIKPALVGDANLDGKVNFADFLLVTSNFNKPGTGWDQGNFNYGPTTNFTDFLYLSANFGNSVALDSAQFSAMDQFALSNGYSLSANADGNGFAVAAVPEPVSASLVGLCGLGLLMRRRSRRTC